MLVNKGVKKFGIRGFLQFGAVFFARKRPAGAAGDGKGCSCGQRGADDRADYAAGVASGCWRWDLAFAGRFFMQAAGFGAIARPTLYSAGKAPFAAIFLRSKSRCKSLLPNNGSFCVTNAPANRGHVRLS